MEHKFQEPVHLGKTPFAPAGLNPITPQQLEQKWVRRINAEVIAKVNAIIEEQWDGRNAVIDHHTLVATVAMALGIQQPEVLKKNLLAQVAETYRNVGWNVNLQSDQRDGDFYVFTKNGLTASQT